MATDISIPQSPVVEQTPAFILEDGIYPFDDPEDKFVIVIGGEEVAWSATYSQAQRSYYEILEVERVHFTRNPANRSILINWPSQTVVLEVA